MIFLYLDESGNYTFSRNGSEYLIYTSISTSNPYSVHHTLCNLETSLKKQNILLESGYFHATEDKQVVRDQVYNNLKSVDPFDIDAVIVEKCKTNPSIQDVFKLYKDIYGILLQYVLQRYDDVSKIIIFVDEAPVQKRKDAIEKGIKETLSNILGKKKMGHEIKYHIAYLPSVSSYGLQAADYCCWALKKKYGEWGEKIDLRPYNEIRSRIRSEFNIFSRGDGTKYY